VCLICIGTNGIYTNFCFICGITLRTGFGEGSSCPWQVSVLFRPLQAHRTYLKTRGTVRSRNRDTFGDSYWCVVSNSGSSLALHQHRFGNILATLSYPIPLLPPLQTVVEYGVLRVFQSIRQMHRLVKGTLFPLRLQASRLSMFHISSL